MTTFSDLSPVTPSWQYVYTIFVLFRQAEDSFLNARASRTIREARYFDLLLFVVAEDPDLPL